ncbi:MAG: serine/threonine-protein kinase [Rikenellaceae bacterium]
MSSEFFTTPTYPSNNYTEIKLLSKSGFNTLYCVEREGKRFIAKAISEEYKGDILYEAILRKEFEISYLLDHYNICRTHSYEKLPELGNVIILEYVDGQTLDKYIAEGNHPKEKILRILSQLCEAMAYAHKKQIIHRDLKPQNIIITHNGDNVKLIDFGLSDSDQHVSLKEPAGSRKYAAPELLMGKKIDSRSDIYSLGIIISELFNSQPPRRIAKIVSRATSYYPNSRYKNVEALSIALNSSLKNFIPVILLLFFFIICYLFYTIQQDRQSQIPSARVDGVSQEEFSRREQINTDFYSHINNSYVNLMSEIYKTSCITHSIPDLEDISAKQLIYYRKSLDSIMSNIKGSSLYKNAQGYLNTHNSEMFSIINNSFPALFWNNTEQIFLQSSDSLAKELKKLKAPKLSSEFLEMSFEDQEQENLSYRAKELEYKRATVLVWAIWYRENKGLSPMNNKLLEYYNND